MIDVTPESMIITRTEGQSAWVRIRDVLLTIIMWCAYLYLMQDFFIFIKTIFDWVVFGIESPDLPKEFKILKTIESYFWIVVINSSVLIGWAIYNQIRFRGKDRRKPSEQIGSEDMGRFYQVPVEQIEKWQETRRMIIHHDAHGNIIQVE